MFIHTGSSWMHLDVTLLKKDATLYLLSVCHLMSYTDCKTNFSTTLEQRKWLSNVYETWRCSLRGSRRMRR